jgi:putative PIN family toxin of toxin-antitoxin system
VGKVKKVVIDTNVFISAFGWGGTPLRIVKMLEKEVIRNCVSESILTELHHAIAYRKIAFPVKLQTSIMEYVLAYSDVYNPKKRLDITPDPDDNKFVECALSADARFVITGDKGLLDLRKFQGVRLITPTEFLQQLVSNKQ